MTTTTGSSTSRRSFLKTGALAAAPLAIAVPASSQASDQSAARLARLEDERAIEALHRAWLRGADTGALAPGLRAIASDDTRDGSLEFADDGQRASLRRPVMLEVESEFTGHSTVEQMARFQGQGFHRHARPAVLASEYVKDKHGWRLARAVLV